MQALARRRAGEPRAEIERLVAGGASLKRIDRRLAQAPLDRERRDALWLYAFERTQHRDRPVVAVPLYAG